jgi:hypothetical protein
MSILCYPGSPEDTRELLEFVRREAPRFRAFRKVIVTPEKTTLRDVNGDGLEFPGLTYGSAALEALLREMGVVFTPSILHNPNATPSGVKEFSISAVNPWGHERVM